jgi:regulation of enolase protein 1 (concanavalin A-like superfamily)
MHAFPDDNIRDQNNGGYELVWRVETGGSSDAEVPEDYTSVPPPFSLYTPESWLKLTRKGHVFSGYTSGDGEKWLHFCDFPLELPEFAYLGLAVTSHNRDKTAAARFSRISVL